MLNELARRAAKGFFEDFLGSEEGEMYFFLLLDTPELKKEIDLKHSRSKKYRLLNSLFEIGVLGKYLSGDSSGSYFLLPPTFIHKATSNKKIISELEEIYLLKHYPVLKKALAEGSPIHIQFNGIVENYLILFLLKYQMKKEATILMGGFLDYDFYKKNLNEEQLSKLRYFYRSDRGPYPGNANPIHFSKIGNRRLAIIDGELLIELLKFPNSDVFFSPEKSYFVGYIVDKNFVQNINHKKINYVEQIKKEIDELIRL